MSFKKLFGAQVKLLRNFRKLTQEELSEQINIDIRQLARIEAGTSFVTSETIEKLCTALNVTYKELFNFEDVEESMTCEDIKKFKQNYSKLSKLMQKIAQNDAKTEYISLAVNSLEKKTSLEKLKSIICDNMNVMNFSKQEIIEILRDDSKNKWLFSLADRVRRENVGDEVHLRGLIEFSNICKSTCKYCGLRCENKNIERYRIHPEDVIHTAEKAVGMGYKTIVLQSGEDKFFSQDIICEIIKEIKKLDTALTLSIGERSFEEYKAFRDSGADRYLIRIETTDRNLYSQMHPNMGFDNRVRCLKDLKALGFETGTGCLVGLPGQTVESLADDILFFKEIGADMVGIGPFIAHPDTPLKDEPNGDFILALKVMALTRILLPDINIPATTAMETLNPNGRIIALQSGANVVMPNVTVTEFREKYEIYPGKVEISDCSREIIEEKINSIDRVIASGYGFRK